MSAATPADAHAAIEARLEAHLDAIDRQLLAAGLAHHQRRQVTQDVEAQLREMLRARAGEAPTAADFEAVLAELDPPEAYAAGVVARSAAEAPPGSASADSFAARTSGLFQSGALSLALAIGGVVLAALVALFTPLAFWLTLLVFLACEVAAIVCGLMAWRTSLAGC